MTDADNIIDVEGENVTYKSIARSYNSRGDQTETVVSSTKKVYLQFDVNGQSLIAAGELQVGDGTCFFKSTETVAQGDRIVRSNGSEFELIDAPRIFNRGGTTQFIEARVKRYSAKSA
jgi:hypothetical protein